MNVPRNFERPLVLFGSPRGGTSVVAGAFVRQGFWTGKTFGGKDGVGSGGYVNHENAARLAEFGILVYEIRPGIIRTDMTAGVTEKYDKLIAEGLAVEPRWGTPQDVGRAVAMLARGELTYATGNILMVDGGLSLPRL